MRSAAPQKKQRENNRSRNSSLVSQPRILKTGGGIVPGEGRGRAEADTDVRKTLKIRSFPDEIEMKAEPFTDPCTWLLL